MLRVNNVSRAQVVLVMLLYTAIVGVVIATAAVALDITTSDRINDQSYLNDLKGLSITTLIFTGLTGLAAVWALFYAMFAK
ncbi:MAG: hypothetical protein CMK92_02750 [Pseudomonas sp.]|nr:hypothetical protein [Pseudomonas sp.]